MRMHYRINDAHVLAALQQAPAVMERHLQRGLDAAGMQMVQTARQKLRQNDSLALSTLIQAITVEKTGSLEREVLPGTDYAIHLEKGTRAGYRPAPAPLLAWLRTRRAAEPERAVFRLQKHIQRHGTKAHPFWQPAFGEAAPRMVQIIRDEVRRGVREVLG